MKRSPLIILLLACLMALIGWSAPVMALDIPIIAVNTTSLTPTCQEGQNAASQNFEVWNSGKNVLNYSISSGNWWISVTPTSGSSTGEHDTILVQYNTAGVAPGTYDGTITVSSAYALNNPTTINVTLTVSPLGSPTISVSSSSLTVSCMEGQNASDQTFEVWNSGGGTLNYTVTSNAWWMSVTPTSGSSTGEHDTITVQFNTSSVLPGNYTDGVITVSAPGVSSQTVQVNLTVYQAVPSMMVSPTILNPTCMEGQNAAPQTFEVWNIGHGTLNYSITCAENWLSVSPASGTSTGEHDVITVNYNTASLGWWTAYNTKITISAPGIPDCYVYVNLTVNRAPAIALSTTSLTATCVQGQNPASQTFEVWNSVSGTTLDYSVTNPMPWMVVNPTSGTSTGEHDTITVAFNASTLPEGTYTGPITVSATGVPSQTVNVTLEVTKPVIEVSPASLTPTCAQGQNAASQTFQVWNSGGGTLSYTITDNAGWLSVTPDSGDSTGEKDTITVNYATTSLAAGTYNAIITVAATDVSAKTIAVTLTVNSPAAISLSATSLNTVCAKGRNAAPQSFQVWNSGGGTLSYTITDNAAWLSVTPNSGTSTGEKDTIAVNYNSAVLSPGTYHANITVSAPGASNTPQQIQVTLKAGATGFPWLLLLFE